MEVPADWWAELGAIGTLEDAAAHLVAMEQAGADAVALVPAPDPVVARDQLADVIRLAEHCLGLVQDLAGAWREAALQTTQTAVGA